MPRQASRSESRTTQCGPARQYGPRNIEWGGERDDPGPGPPRWPGLSHALCGRPRAGSICLRLDSDSKDTLVLIMNFIVINTLSVSIKYISLFKFLSESFLVWD